MYIDIERAILTRTVEDDVLPRVVSTSTAQELQALVDRFAALSIKTNDRVRAMIEAAELNEEEKRQTKLRLIHSRKSA